MSFYLAREVSKVLRRVLAETSLELKLLSEKWKLLLAGMVFQYIHGLAARGVHYLHRPGPILQDLGYMLLPELGKERGYMSETLFSCIFLSFVLWTFSPFIYKIKRFYTVLIWRRILAFLVMSQCLRIMTFYSTQLPGPNYHCREGSPLARLPAPDNALEILLLNFPRGVMYGCGDLIFSSHMIFTLVFVNTYHKYGSQSIIKALGWIAAVVQSLLIIASRKHYSVDVVVAWYAVNLVVFFLDTKLSEMPDRSVGSSSTLLPLTNKDKLHSPLKLLNANSAPDTTADFRPRTQTNSKNIDNNANHMDSDTNLIAP